MHLIAHRINKIDQLKKIDQKFGIEIDIRDEDGALIVVHDPFKKGPSANIVDDNRLTSTFIWLISK